MQTLPPPIVVGKTRLLDMYGDRGSLYRPAIHQIIEHNRWFDTVVKSVRDAGHSWHKDLFFYLHRVSGVFVVALWIVRPDAGLGLGIFEPIESMKGHPTIEDGGEHPPSLEYMMMRMRPALAVAKEIRQQLWENEREEAAAVAEERQQRDDLAAFWKKREPTLAKALLSGMIPFAGTTGRNATDLGDDVL